MKIGNFAHEFLNDLSNKLGRFNKKSKSSKNIKTKNGI